MATKNNKKNEKEKEEKKELEKEKKTTKNNESQEKPKEEGKKSQSKKNVKKEKSNENKEEEKKEAKIEKTENKPEEEGKIEEKEAKNDKKTDKKVKKVKKQKDKAERKANTKFVSTIIAILIILVLIAGVSGTIIRKNTYHTSNPVATMKVENFGTIKIELYPEYAPNTVSNFIKLANNGFYDGKTFHRTIPDFCIQGGDPNGDGTGSATYKDLGIGNDEAKKRLGNSANNVTVGEVQDQNYNIKGEFILNNFTQNTLKFEEGTIAMARSDYSSQGSTTITKKGYDTASCQFFITTSEQSSLNGSYAAFGKVIDGMDIVKQISNVEVQTRDQNTTDSNLTADMPVNKPVITEIRVDTHGVDYGTPDTMEPFDYYQYLMQQYYSGSTQGASQQYTTIG